VWKIGCDTSDVEKEIEKKVSWVHWEMVQRWSLDEPLVVWDGSRVLIFVGSILRF
jgi:hypothetical protein